MIRRPDCLNRNGAPVACLEGGVCKLQAPPPTLRERAAGLLGWAGALAAGRIGAVGPWGMKAGRRLEPPVWLGWNLSSFRFFYNNIFTFWKLV